MTFPWQLHIGSLSIPLHPIFETPGIFIGFRYFMFLRKRQADVISNGNRLSIIVAALFGAVIGSRLVGGLENPDAMLQSANIAFHFYQNKTILGGLVGGLAGVELVKCFIGEKKPSGDLFTFPIILAMIIGRIGCFGMGVHEETYGTPTSFFLAMHLGDEHLRHPVVLYEIAFLICLWFMLGFLKKQFTLPPGALFKMFMIAYLLFRFLLDFIKPHYSFGFGLSTIQVVCLAGLAYYYRFIVHPKKLVIAYA